MFYSWRCSFLAVDDLRLVHSVFLNTVEPIKLLFPWWFNLLIDSWVASSGGLIYLEDNWKITNPTCVLTYLKALFLHTPTPLSPLQLLVFSLIFVSRSSPIAVLKSIWNYACYAVRENFFLSEDPQKETLPMTATTSREREKLPTFVLEKLGWVCPSSSSPCVFVHWNVIVVVKTGRQRISLWNLIQSDRYLRKETLPMTTASSRESEKLCTLVVNTIWWVCS